ncbi:MAG TPA: glycosyltransferase 87 family protein [Pirellulales bacterium]|nr:glycosyltransferase 87 family protein [Pirellulales bacterium]
MPAEIEPKEPPPAPLPRSWLWPRSAGPWPWWLGHHPLVALAIALAVWGWVDVRSRGRIEPGNLVEHRTDFTVYTEAGAACFDGRDPYAVTNPRGWGYLYPPLPAILVAPLAQLDPEWQVTIWFFVSLLALAGCYRELRLTVDLLAESMSDLGAAWPRAGEEGGPSHFAAQNWDSPPEHRCGRWRAGRWNGAPWPPNGLPWAAAIAAALPTLNCLQRGQVGIVQLYLLLAGFRLLATADRRGGQAGAWRAVAAGLSLALAVVIKVTAALPVGLLLLERLAHFSCRRSAPDCTSPEPPACGEYPRGFFVLAPSLALRATCVSRHTATKGGPAAAWRRRERRGSAGGLATGLAAGMALWLLVVPALAIGWQRNLDCLARWASLVPTKAIDTGPGLFAGDSYSVRNQSLVNAVRHLGNWIPEESGGPGDRLPFSAPNDAPRAKHNAAVDQVLLAVRLAVLGTAALAAVWAGRRQLPLAGAAVFGLGMVATLVVSPVARTHYFLLVAPAVLFAAWFVDRAGWPRRAQWLAWTPTVLVVPHYLFPAEAGRIGWLGIGIAVWLIAAGAAVWLAGRRAADARVLAWRQPALEAPALTAQSAPRREAAVSSAAAGFDPSES